MHIVAGDVVALPVAAILRIGDSIRPEVLAQDLCGFQQDLLSVAQRPDRVAKLQQKCLLFLDYLCCIFCPFV
jgi:hypothetical protein